MEVTKLIINYYSNIGIKEFISFIILSVINRFRIVVLTAIPSVFLFSIDFNILFIFSFLFDFLCLVIALLLIVAVLTLLERKVMGSMQRRRGPNVVGPFGLLQPFADGIKLLSKEFVLPSNVNKVLFVLGPLFSFTVSLVLWSFLPFGDGGRGGYYLFDNELTLLFIFGLSSLGVYGIIISGWASNSLYAFLGSIRASAQMISYEVSFGLAVLPVVIICQSFDLRYIGYIQQFGWWNGVLLIPAGVMFFISSLAETNRTPFDLPEAEGELVAGFNVEYSAIFFAFFFLSEYANIVFMGTLSVVLFWGGWLSPYLFSDMFYSWKMAVLLFIFIWVRAVLPRYRYDQLIQIGWKGLLPLTMGYFLFVAGNFFFSVQTF